MTDIFNNSNFYYKNTKKIYRTIHIVWVGDESKRPDRCIKTWRSKIQIGKSGFGVMMNYTIPNGRIQRTSKQCLIESCVVSRT